MAASTRDTESSLYLRFHANPAQRDSLLRMTGKVFGFNPFERLVGMSNDSGELNMIFSFPISKETIREDYTRVQSAFLRLYDYFPSLAEAPSETQVETALDFIRSASPARQLQYA